MKQKKATRRQNKESENKEITLNFVELLRKSKQDSRKFFENRFGKNTLNDLDNKSEKLEYEFLNFQ